MVGPEEVLRFIPDARTRHLPALIDKSNGGNGENLQEREIMYKLLFDMKNDLNDLKSLVFNLISSNNLRVPDIKAQATVNTLQEAAGNEFYTPNPPAAYPVNDNYIEEHPQRFQPEGAGQKGVIQVEESLSLEEMEKEMIKKALITIIEKEERFCTKKMFLSLKVKVQYDTNHKIRKKFHC